MAFHRRLPAFFLVLVALALVAACSHGGGGSNARQGNVRVVLSSDTTSIAAATAGASPAASIPEGTTGPSGTALSEHDDEGDGDILFKLEHVNVMFSSLMARNLDGDLIDLTINLPQTVDLIGLINGQQATLPTGTLPPGMYDQIVVVIKYVEFVFVDGTKVALTPPGGGWTKIVPVTPFEVVEGQTITIELRFKPWHAFEEFDGEFQFFPDFDCSRQE